jgi:Phage portal protein/Phage Mu protein F like protein
LPNEIIVAPRMGVRKSFSQRLYAAYEGFFGPLLPLQEQTPETTDLRSVDYPAGANLNYLPRGSEDVTFSQLRNLADAYFLVRAVIETRKDQVRKLTWRLAKKLKNGDAPQKSRRDSESDPVVQKLTNFLKFPDGFNDWETWICMLLEDLFVIDAATLAVDRTKGGEILGLRPVDGATIHPLYSPAGVRPMPPERAYQQIIKGMVNKNITIDNLLYMPRNVRVNKLYGFSPVEQIILIVNLGIRRALHQIAHYTTGNIPDALCMVPAEWDTEQIKQFQSYFDAALSGNLAARRKITFIPGGGGKDSGKANLEFTKPLQLKDEMDEFLARIICFTFSLPPTAFIKQQNRSNSQQQQKTALEEGLEPIKVWIANRINYIIQSPRLFNQPEIEFAWNDDPEVDPLVQAQIDKIYISCGKSSIDEVRERDGQDPIGVKNGIVTATGFIPFKDGAATAPTPVVAPGTPAGKAGTPAAKKSPANKALFAHCPDHTECEATCQPCLKAEAARIEAAYLAKEAAKKKVVVQTKILPDRIEKRVTGLSRSLTRFLSRMGKAAAHQAADAYANVTKSTEDEADRVLHDVELDWAGIVASMGESLTETARETGRDTLTEIGTAEDATMGAVFQDALDYATARSAEMVGMKWDNGVLVDNPNAQFSVAQTTRDEIRRIIVQALIDGMTPAEVETAIKNSLTFSATRAEMIARTELASAHVQGALAAARRSGVVMKKYSMLGSEHDLDDECDVNADAGEIGLEEGFPSGHSGPPYHPNCVCAVGFKYE